MRDWQTRRKAKHERMRSAAALIDGRLVRTERAADLLQALLRPGDRVALEGDNQKQADFLARSLTQLDPAGVHDLHLLISSVSLPEHLDVFEKGICKRIDFLLRRGAERADGRAGRGRDRRGRCHPHLRRAVRADVRRPDSRCRPAVRDASRPRREPVHRPEHGRHAGDRRGGRLPRWRRRGAGQRDRGHAAPGRHPGRLG